MTTTEANALSMFRELGLPVYSKKEEYMRSIEMFNQIYKEKGFYYAIALLYDSGYTSKDLKEMMELTHPSKK